MIMNGVVKEEIASKNIPKFNRAGDEETKTKTKSATAAATVSPKREEEDRDGGDGAATNGGNSAPQNGMSATKNAKNITANMEQLGAVEGAPNGRHDVGNAPSMAGAPVKTELSVVASSGRPKLQHSQAQMQSMQHPDFGGQVAVRTEGGFPSPGSTLGPFFCLGRLGKGTFCSIHKCINMHYFHRRRKETNNNGDGQVKYDNRSVKKGENGHSAAAAMNGSSNGTAETKHIKESADAFSADEAEEKSQCRVVAAKVEVGEFRNSGVLGGEATILQFLDGSLPKETVPLYMGHYRGNEDVSAIVMEYLPGQDMHQIRDWATGQLSRRIALEDAVYLTADVMLPLLQRMHQAGIVHRDVKPSNCVKRGGLKDFAMVDFGLSKSIVVPSDSPFSDTEHPWNGNDWIRPPNFNGQGHYRQERETADFRGTSMYASVRVHQLKDYCPRDDMWSLMYVFCDLATGGLPWMSHAANRNREGCQKLKERIHGEEPGMPDQTSMLLFGHEYHIAMFRKFGGEIDPPEGSIERDDSTMPPPLNMSKSEKKIGLLRQAFEHLKTLRFCDMPDYDLLQRCIRGFLDEPIEDKSVTPIDWKKLLKTDLAKQASSPLTGDSVPTWELSGLLDDMESDTFVNAERERAVDAGEEVSGEPSDLSRLPLEFQFRVAQMDYNAIHSETIAPYIALKDWMAVALPLLYGPWDSQVYEKGGHRSNTDGYRRQLYLKIIAKCRDCAKKFKMFRDPECFYEVTREGPGRLTKRRKVSHSGSSESSMTGIESDMLAVSKILFQLAEAKAAEEKKTYAPPPLLSFGS